MDTRGGDVAMTAAAGKAAKKSRGNAKHKGTSSPQVRVGVYGDVVLVCNVVCSTCCAVVVRPRSRGCPRTPTRSGEVIISPGTPVRAR